MKLIDPNHPFFRPLWVRIAVTAFTAGWAVVELVNGAVFWGALFLTLAAGCVYAFFLSRRSD